MLFLSAHLHGAICHALFLRDVFTYTSPSVFPENLGVGTNTCVVAVPVQVLQKPAFILISE